MLAVKSGVPIVPVGITGTEDAITKLLHFRKPHIVVRFGSAFTIPELKRGERSADLQRWTDKLMYRIASLLPESYRGVYSNQPQLK